ncbi:unnamed protein product [Closterium sp. NIES-54]
MASWKSTGTYVDEVPPPGANIVSGMWIFRVKRPPGSLPAFKARYVARGFSQRQGVDFFQTFSPTPKMTTLWVLLHVAAQRDYELHSLDFSTAFLQGSLHEGIWLHRPPGFIGSFATGTQWSLRRPVYGLRQAPREWHDTLRTTLAALGFAPSTADPSLFLRTNATLPPFYVLVYVDDLVFATADTEALAHVKSELQKRHTCTDLGELTSNLGLRITRDRAQRTITLTQSHMVQQVLQRFGFTYSSPQSTPLPTGHSLSAPPSDESVEPSGPYAELVGCLMYLMTCTRPDLAYPLSLLARYVAPGRHRKRSSQGYTFSLGSGSVSWRSTRSSSVLSSNCEAEIYAGAMAAQELRWLTYLLTDLGEVPRSPPVLYVDNKAMLALCQEHRLEHRTKHIALRYFLARELQQRGQLCLAYVASQANTADVFTKALGIASRIAEGDCYRCVPPDPGIAPGALGASESGTLPGTVPAQALHTFMLDSDTSRCFFRDSTTLTPLSAPLPVILTDPSGGPVVAHSSTVLPCPPVPSGSLSGLHLPSFSTNLVSTAALQDAMVTTTTPGGQCVSICACTRTGRHLATFTRQPGSSLYTLATEPPQVAASAQVFALDQVATSCSCRLLSHQTLLWHHRLGHPYLPRLRGMHSHLLVSSLPRSLPPLPPSPALPCLPCIEGRQRASPHSSFPPTTAPLHTLHIDSVSSFASANVTITLCLHSDRGGEFSSNLLRDICHGEGILQLFTLPDSLQQNGIAERRIGLFMEIARTCMIHAVAPHFLWPFAFQYAVHQLNLWPHVSLPQTSPTLRWTGEVGDASVFRVWGSRAFVRDTSANKLSARAIPCVFLGFVPDTPGWRFYHPTSRRVLPSQDVTFDESVPFYRLFPYHSALPPPPPLFLAPSSPPVDPFPPQGPAPSGVSQVDPILGTAPVDVAVGSGAASGGAKPGVAGSEGAGSGGAEPGGEEPGGAEPEGVEPGGAESEGAESGGAEPRGVASSGGPPGASPRLSLQQLRTAAAGPGGARTRGAGAAEIGGVGGAGAGDPMEPGAAGAGGFCANRGGAGGVGAKGAGVGGTGAGVGAAGAGAVDPGAGGAGGTSQPPLQPPSPLPAPSPYTEQSGGLTERREPTSCPVLPVCTARRALRSRPPPVPCTHAMALRPSSVPLRSASASPPSVGGECALGTDVLEDRQEEFECLAGAVRCFASMLLAPEGDPDAPDIPTPRSYAEAITGPYSSQWQEAMDAEMASSKSTRTYVDEVPPPTANIVDDMWIFMVKRPPGSPPTFKTRYVARGFGRRQGVDYFQTFSPTSKMITLWVLLHVAAQHDYKLLSLEFISAFLQGSLHEEIWLRRPPGFTGSFPTGTQTTLAAPGFIPSTADLSLFLRTDTSLPPFYVFVYLGLQITRDRARRTITLTQSHMVHQVLQCFCFQFSSPQPTPLSTSHSLSAPPSDESIEPSGPYPELVGCLIYLMMCTQPDLAYPLNLLARYVAPSRHRKVHWDATKRVLHYLCSTSSMGLVLGGRGLVVLTGHTDASWVGDSATQQSSQGYTFNLGAMAALELRWLTYLLFDLGEQPRLSLVVYVDNKAMIALCQEHRQEHRMKHIALR